MDSKLCKTPADDFCYICGDYSAFKFKRQITVEHKRAYLSYFGTEICNQDKPWVPHCVCNSCHVTLLKWMNGFPGYEFEFEYPMRWYEPRGALHEDCYFCVTNVTGATQQNNDKVVYANVGSVTKPIMRTGNAINGVWPTASVTREAEENVPFDGFTDEDIENFYCSEDYDPMKEEAAEEVEGEEESDWDSEYEYNDDLDDDSYQDVNI